MKTKKLLILVALIATTCCAFADNAVSMLLPKPHELSENAATFDLTRNVSITDPTNSTLLASLFTTGGSPSATVTVSLVSDATLGTFDYTLAGFPNEGYKLEVTTDAITIQAVTKTGVIRAAQTLMQLAAANGGTSIPGVSITDWAAFKLRGYMHDVGRSFVSFDELKKEVDLLSRFKVNVFHWHLTDNQGFRFESKTYPQLNQATNMTRFAGQYYTQAQCTELEAYAAERGMIIIPEIDMPGHSQAFQTAMGFAMNSEQGKPVLKALLDELAAAFPLAPYLHIGCDEAGTTAAFVNEMSQYVKETLGRRVLVWNPISGVSISKANLPYIDMTEMWGTAGKKIDGLPNIDCRYNYINHFDVFADLVGIYKSNIYYTDKGNAEVAGAISGLWNDRKTPTETDIIRQNNLWANAIATAERGWMGGGKQYIETGGTTLPNSGSEFEEFADWERRFLYYKGTWLKDESIPYVKQTNIRWRITQPFPNGGTATAAFPPEESTADVLPDEYTYDGQTYTTSMATGGGIYLRHVWGTIVPAFFSSPQLNTTAYAWTYVYSPTAQTAGALIEFQNYSRSENDKAPDNGNWDRKGSRVWVNGSEVAPPTWGNSGKSINSEVDLQNENFTARKPIAISLKAGWNKIFLKLPYVSASNVRLNKWMFTFVLTDAEGKNALEGITYSPIQSLDANIDDVVTIIGDIKTYVHSKCGTAVGLYPESAATDLLASVATVEATLQSTLTADEREAQVANLQMAFETFKSNLATATINQPLASTASETHYYTLCTPQRGSRYVTSSGAGAELGGTPTLVATSYWKFVARADGTWDIVNAYDDSYIAPNSTNNTALTSSATSPSAGWKISKASTDGQVIITSGNCQFNQTNTSSSVLSGGYRLFNWGNGTNTTDTGCQYAIEEVDEADIPYSFSFKPSEATVYTLNNTSSANRGALVYDGSSTNVSLVASADLDATNPNHQWVLYPTGTVGQYYLYNVGARKFAIPTAIAQSDKNAWVFSDNAVAVCLNSETVGTYRIKMAKDPVSGTNQAVIGVNRNLNPAVFNYNDAGSDFTITLVKGADQSAAVKAAVSKLISSQKPLTSYPQSSGWYAIQIKSKNGAAAYAGRFMQAAASLYNDLYPLTFTGAIDLQPAISEPTFLTYIDHTSWDVNTWQLPDGRYLVKNASNKFPTPSLTPGNVLCGYDNGNYFKTEGNWFADPYNSSANYFFGETTSMRTAYTVYPIDLDAAGLTPWQVTITNGSASTLLTCKRSDVKGQTAVYSGGYFFLPSDVTPKATDFAMEGMIGSPVIDAENKTISVQYDPSVSLLPDGIDIIQGNETTGKGNAASALLRMKVTPFATTTPTEVSITLSGADQISKVAVYATDIDELHAKAASPVKLGEATVSGQSALSITMDNPTTIDVGTSAYLWVTADVKADATELATIDAAITSLTYTNDYIKANALEANVLDLTAKGNPDGQMCIYKQQTALWTPDHANGIYYRIPTMLCTDGGNIVALADYRHDHPYDLGKNASNGLGAHVIDVVARRSTDGGLTWQDETVVAAGDGKNANTWGFGDPAIVADADGTLHCLMAAGSTSYASGSGMQAMGYSKSSDGGATWTAVKDIYADIDKGGLTIASAFTSGGKGVTFANGRMAFAFLGKVGGTTNVYPIYSDDKGQTWHIQPTVAYGGGDESKFEIMNDGSLLLSVRKGSYNGTALRAYNRTTGDASGEGIGSWGTAANWGSEMNANGCNADILYYNRSTDNPDRPDVILHTLTKSYSTYRKDLRLYASFDQGQTWKEAFQLQPGYAAYSSLQKLPNGDLAIIYEDGSIGNKDQQDCYAMNYIVLSSEALNARIDELYKESLYTTASIITQGETNTSAPFVTWTPSSGWATSFTTNATSGLAGVTVSATSQAFNRQGGYDQRVLLFRPTAAGASDVYTITAPDGYIIDGYTIGGYFGTSTQTYTLTAEDGTSVAINKNKAQQNPPTYLTISGLNKKSTTITFSNSNTANTTYAFITHFVVKLTKQYPLALHAIGDASYGTLYLPFGITLPSNVTAYKVAVNGNWAIPTSMGQELPKETPALLYSAEGATTALATVNDAATADASDNQLQGVLTKQHIDGYVLNQDGNDVGFFRLSSSGELDANRAYLPANAGEVKGFILNWSTDGIEKMRSGENEKMRNGENEKMRSAIFDLSGRRVNKPQKGIYIMNGNKVIVE